ncbi:MAG: DUF349 domain-containing protein, partial [Pseudomonadota bacterium]
SRIDQRFERNEQAKRSLVAEARKLAHATDRDAAIEQAKALQARWKRIPPARRAVDQKLWQEFRAPIDPLFEALSQARVEQRAQDRERMETLETLCEEAEQLAQSPVEDWTAVAGRLAGLEQQWNEQQAPAALRQRFGRALDHFEQRKSVHEQQRQLQQSNRLQALADALQQAWLDRVSGAALGDQSTVEADPDAPNGTATRLQGRLGEFCDPASDQASLAAVVAGLTEHARQVVVEMETLAGLDTPAEDRSLRMDYQVERLSERLGQGAVRPELGEEVRALNKRWLLSHPHEAAAHEELKKRYLAGSKILKNMSA